MQQDGEKFEEVPLSSPPSLSEQSEKKLQGETRERVGSKVSDSSYDVVSVPSENTSRRGRVDSTSSYELVSANLEAHQKRTTIKASELSLSDHEPSDSDPHDAILRNSIKDCIPSQSDGEQHDEAELAGSETHTQTKIEPPSPDLSSHDAHHEVPLVDRNSETRTPSFAESDPEEMMLQGSHKSHEQPSPKKRSSIQSGSEQDEIGSTSSEETELKGYKEKLKTCFAIFYKKISNSNGEYVKKNGFVCNFFFSRFGLANQDRRTLQLQDILGTIGTIEDRLKLVILSTELLKKETPEDRYNFLMQKLEQDDELISILDKVIQDKETHEKVKALQIQREKMIKLVLSDDDYELVSDRSHSSSILNPASQSVSEASDIDSNVSEKTEIKAYKKTLKECFAIFYNKLKDANSENANAYRAVCDFFFKMCGLPNHHKRSQELQSILEQLTNADDRKILLDFSAELRTKKTRKHRYEYLIKRLSEDVNGHLIQALDRAIKDDRVQALVQRAQTEENEKWQVLAPKVLERTDLSLNLEPKMLMPGQFNEAKMALEIELQREAASEVEQLNFQERIVALLRQEREKKEAVESPFKSSTDREQELISRNVELVRLADKEKRKAVELTRKLELAELERQRLTNLVAQQAKLLNTQAVVEPIPVSIHFAQQLEAIETSAQKNSIELPQAIIDEKAENELAQSMQKAWEAMKEEAAKRAQEDASARQAQFEANARQAQLEAQLRAFAAAGRTLGTRGGRRPA